MLPGGMMLLGTTLLLVAGAFGGLFLIARLIKVRGLEDEAGQARRLAATTPNVFLWAALIPVQLAHDLSFELGMLVMWAILLFFVGLVIRERWLVHRVRENIALPRISLSWSTETVKIASLPKGDQDILLAKRTKPSAHGDQSECIPVGASKISY
jgi:hypothetical protein